MVDPVLLKRLQVPLSAPIIDRGFHITCQLYNVVSHKNIRVFREKLFIILVHILSHNGWNLSLHFHRVTTAVPPSGSRVALGEHLTVLKIGDNILFLIL